MSNKKGISFFNINTGETILATSEPQFAALLNSGDRGINASRHQDFGWRLSPEDTVELETTLEDRTTMDRIASLRNVDVADVDESYILEYMFFRRMKLAAKEKTVTADRSKFEAKYEAMKAKLRKSKESKESKESTSSKTADKSK